MTAETSTGWWDAWSAALDGLEASVITTEEMLRTGQQGADAEPWTPPVGLGPMPSELASRAQEIALRQHTILDQLPKAVETKQRQWDLTRRINDATSARHASIYIDTTV